MDLQPKIASRTQDSSGRVIAAYFAGPREGAGRNRWLVAIDGSPHALKATEQVLTLGALSPELEIEFVTVVPPLSKEASADLETLAWPILKPACELAESRAVAWRAQVQIGDPAQTLVDQAKALGCVGIAVGSHGKGAILSMVLGSVSYEVLKRSPVSVLIVR